MLFPTTGKNGMKILFAPDSFKECLSAAEAAACLAEGWRRIRPADDCCAVPMADGGEGTVDALVAADGGEYIETRVTGPLGAPVTARYGLIHGGETAVIEMAAASGLALIPDPARRDPAHATSRGTGELMRHALGRGVKRMILGVGGSATNDGGAGMARALGWALRDSTGRELEPGGLALARLARFDGGQVLPRLRECDIRVACDVNNPLCGPCGASQIYGPQKGATPELAEELDRALAHFGRMADEILGCNTLETPGAGAAGGLGAGLIAFAGAHLVPGVELVAEACGLEEQLQGVDLVVTGEGCIDGQSVYGKTPVGVARLARRHGAAVIAVAGALGSGYNAVHGHGIDAVFCLCGGPVTEAEAMRNAGPLLRALAAQLARFASAMQSGTVR
jgi:glycerate 2-kinase